MYSRGHIPQKTPVPSSLLSRPWWKSALALHSRIFTCKHWLEIPEIDVKTSDTNTQQHHWKSHQHEGQKPDAVTRALGEAGNDKIGTCPDQGTVTAQASTQRQRPPQRHEVFGTTKSRRHGFNYRDHGCHERYVVDHCRGDCRNPQDGKGRYGKISVGIVDDKVRENTQYAGLLDSLDRDEQADEEENGYPLDVAEGLVYFL